jgi:hypothetical protein
MKFNGSQLVAVGAERRFTYQGGEYVHVWSIAGQMEIDVINVWNYEGGISLIESPADFEEAVAGYVAEVEQDA